MSKANAASKRTNKNTMISLLLLLSCLMSTMAFAPAAVGSPSIYAATCDNLNYHLTSTLSMTGADESDPNETVARRIIVTGDVDGGYYRTCVINEARRFRKLSGTMSPPDGGKQAEIYVEGKRKSIESFIRWCRRGDVGLSQTITVADVMEEFPTGLYDDFYVDTGRKEQNL